MEDTAFVIPGVELGWVGARGVMAIGMGSLAVGSCPSERDTDVTRDRGGPRDNVTESNGSAGAT